MFRRFFRAANAFSVCAERMITDVYVRFLTTVDVTMLFMSSIAVVYPHVVVRML